MTITIHQPEHAVWLGLVDKIRRADLFVILDTVQFRKNYFQNRNRIRTKTGWDWITVPVKKHPLDTPISKVEIGDVPGWQEKILQKLRMSYGKAPYFDLYFPELERIYSAPRAYLSELNVELLKFILRQFGVSTKIVLASDYPELYEKESSDLILHISKLFKADTYISGPFGRDYLKLDDFKKEGIEVTFHAFEHPEYAQMHGEFIPGLSSLDLLFNHGPESFSILTKTA